MPEIKMNEVMDALNTLRGEVEKGSLTGESKAKIEKCEKFLDEQESKNQELNTKLSLTEQKQKDIEDEIKELQKQLSEPRATMTEKKQEELENQMKSFEKAMRKGLDSLSEAECKYLRTDKNEEGGFLVPDSVDSQIIKNITEISPIRSLARVKRIGTKRMHFPVRSGLVTVYMRGEGQAATLSNSTYGREKITVHNMTGMTNVTREDLMDSAFSMESLLNKDFAEAFAQTEGQLFVSGDGDASEEPYGFMNDAGVAVTVSGNATTLTSLDPIITLTGELKTGYMPVFGANRKTIAHLRKIKNGQGDYLWQNGNVQAGIPNTLAGYRVVELPDLDDIGADTFPIVFGDFRQAYTIVDRAGVYLLRDGYTQAASGKVRFIMERRIGGDVTKAEALKKLKIAAA